MKSLFLIKLFLLSQLSEQYAASFEHVYALGDSVTDTGNVYRASNHTVPDPEFYYKGRFSDGPVWMEYLAKSLSANLTNYAYGGATSDNITYPAKTKLNVPGCIQQADTFIKDYKHKRNPRINGANTLVSVSFFGNDFWDVKAKADLAASNIDTCLRKILDNTDVKHIIIPTSLAPEIYPYFPNRTIEMQERTSRLTIEYCQILSDNLRLLREDYPKLKTYKFNHKDLMMKLRNITIPLTDETIARAGTCIPFTPDGSTSSEKPIPCKDPSKFVFYDRVHPASHVHKIMSDTVLSKLPRLPHALLVRHSIQNGIIKMS